MELHLRILRFSWDGQEIRDYSLDLRRIPFCVDQQGFYCNVVLHFRTFCCRKKCFNSGRMNECMSPLQVLKAVPLADKGAYVTKISYSPLLGGYAIVLNDGRAAFLVASSNNFDPNVSTD